jgi:hypothetical protein
VYQPDYTLMGKGLSKMQKEIVEQLQKKGGAGLFVTSWVFINDVVARKKVDNFAGELRYAMATNWVLAT